ncbi:MAG TPA: DUF3108 domain-containing protein [Blastocatellia bacterium]|jgi:hypothetical protein
MFRKLSSSVAIISLICLASSAQTRNIKTELPADSVKKIVSPLVVGEQLNYEVSWESFVVAGELTLEVKERRNFDGVDGFRVSAVAESVGLVKLLGYKVRDVYESYIDAATLQPFRATKSAQHGKRSEQDQVTIDHGKRAARLADGKTIEIPADTYDLVGLLCAVRGMDLTVGQKRNFTLLEDGKLYPLQITVEAKEKIQNRSDKYDVVRITTKALNARGSQDPYKLRIYVTTDSRRLPVLITASPSWGEVRVELTSVMGTSKK